MRKKLEQNLCLRGFAPGSPVDLPVHFHYAPSSALRILIKQSGF
jgi:hypothetical protein